MSYLDTKQALITNLINNLPIGLTSADVAFENKTFDPSGKDIWIAAYFIPATTKALGKTISDCDEQRGIFQVSIFIVKNNANYDYYQLQTLDEIVVAFRYNTKLVYNAQTVYISESTVNSGTESESWFKRDVSINYLTFSKRG